MRQVHQWESKGGVGACHGSYPTCHEAEASAQAGMCGLEVEGRSHLGGGSRGLV
jgi:hypothetical protein